MADSIGMMEGAFFVSKNELLGWINNILKLNLTKVEQLGTGAVYCQILDVCYPGQIPMHKINWKARYDYEFLNNYKLLQQAFVKLKIQKVIDVSKLSKAKYQDNLEFGQWMKRFFELKFGKDGRADYDAQGRRGGVKPDFGCQEKNAQSKGTNFVQNDLESRKKPEAGHEKGSQPYKKVKLNPSTPKNSASNETDKENVKPVDNSKLLIECQELEDRLRSVEEIVMGTQESDKEIMKKLRNFLGVKLQTPSVRLFEELSQRSQSIYEADLLEDADLSLMRLNNNSV